MTQYTIKSTGLFHSPGFVPWLIHVYRTDPKTALKIAREAFPEMPAKTRKKLLAGEIEIEIDMDEEVVRFTD